MEKESLKIVPPFSSCFFQFSFTTQVICFAQNVPEKHPWRCLCPPPFTHHEQRNFLTSRRAVGHGSCTSKVVAFLKKTSGSIVRGRKLDFAQREMIPLTVFMYQAVIIDEIVGRGPSKFAIRGDRIFIKCLSDWSTFSDTRLRFS